MRRYFQSLPAWKGRIVEIERMIQTEWQIRENIARTGYPAPRGKHHSHETGPAENRHSHIPLRAPPQRDQENCAFLLTKTYKSANRNLTLPRVCQSCGKDSGASCPLLAKRPNLPPLPSGHFMCYNKRTLHVLMTHVIQTLDSSCVICYKASYWCGPSQKIEFVFAASPETIQGEPQEWWHRRSSENQRCRLPSSCSRIRKTFLALAASKGGRE